MTKHTRWWIAAAWLAALPTAAATGAPEGDSGARPVRLFILSGQSNMVGMKPDESFTPIVKQAFPDDDVIVVKFAVSGQLIRMWYKDWQAPEGAEVKGQGKNGRHYDTLMAKVAEAMEGRPRPVSVTFVWMQGEADANHKGYGDVYEKALVGLLDQLQTDLGRKDIFFVLGRISDFGNDKPEERPSWKTVREAQVKFAEADPHRRAWVDTDDLNGKQDGLHYNPEGYRKLGERFAEASVKLIVGKPTAGNQHSRLQRPAAADYNALAARQGTLDRWPPSASFPRRWSTRLPPAKSSNAPQASSKNSSKTPLTLRRPASSSNWRMRERNSSA